MVKAVVPNVIKHGIAVVRDLEVDYIVLDNVILVSPNYIKAITTDFSLKVLPLFQGRGRLISNFAFIELS